VVDGSDYFINLHKRVRKYKRGEKWSGRDLGEYNDVHAWLRMRPYHGDKQCKRYNTIHKQMKEDYREWEADKLEAQKWIEDEYELDSQELIDDELDSQELINNELVAEQELIEDYKWWEYALDHASESNAW